MELRKCCCHTSLISDIGDLRFDRGDTLDSILRVGTPPLPLPLALSLPNFLSSSQAPLLSSLPPHINVTESGSAPYGGSLVSTLTTPPKLKISRPLLAVRAGIRQARPPRPSPLPPLPRDHPTSPRHVHAVSRRLARPPFLAPADVYSAGVSASHPALPDRTADANGRRRSKWEQRRGRPVGPAIRGLCDGLLLRRSTDENPGWGKGGEMKGSPLLPTLALCRRRHACGPSSAPP